ncbi:hypothetical protein B0H11DRAFT_2218610 [Mycena galericulata]|nr:hypothetical protein B0H11DRAFT_2218610 [Mycena galericulata]
MHTPQQPQTPPRFEASAYLARMSRLKQFVATAAVLSAYGWASEGNAKVLRERMPEDNATAVCDGYLIASGVIAHHKCFVGPVGSWSDRFSDPLHKAKISLILQCSQDPDLKEAWKASLDNLHKFEGEVCSGRSQHFFGEPDEHGVETLRFTRPVFAKKGNGPAEGDTTRWPVGSKHQEALKETAKTHDVQPLPVFDEKDDLSSPTDLERILPGSTAEVTFRLLHYSFPRDGVTVDAMIGEIAQISILKSPPPKAPTPFSRRKGIFRPAPSLDISGAWIPRSAPATRTPAAPAAPPAPPPQFASHRRPESSSYGSHAFVYAQPFVPTGVPTEYPLRSEAPPPLQTSERQLTDPTTPPAFASHLQPETSEYGAHPFIFASSSPTNPGVVQTAPPAPSWTSNYPPSPLPQSFGRAGPLLDAARAAPFTPYFGRGHRDEASGTSIALPKTTAGPSQQTSHAQAPTPSTAVLSCYGNLGVPGGREIAFHGPSRFAAGLGGSPFAVPGIGGRPLGSARPRDAPIANGELSTSTAHTAALLASAFPRDYQTGSFPSPRASDAIADGQTVASPTPVKAVHPESGAPTPHSRPPTPSPATRGNTLSEETPARPGSRIASRPPTPFNTPRRSPTPRPELLYIFDEGSMRSTAPPFRGESDVMWNGSYAASPAQYIPVPPESRSHSPALSYAHSFTGEEYVVAGGPESDLFSGGEKRKHDDADDERPRKRASKEIEPGSQGNAK